MRPCNNGFAADGGERAAIILKVQWPPLKTVVMPQKRRNIMKKEIQIVCVGNPEFGDCVEVLNISTEHETVCPVCGTSYTAECAKKQASRMEADLC